MTPTSHSAPSIGVADARPRSSISHLANGVTRMPPADSPVDAMDRATLRRMWYQRVTTVVTGIRPAPLNPKAKTAYTTYSCQRSWTWPSSASAAAPSTAPPTMTMRTSWRAINRATQSPTTPATMKKSVVASEIDASGQPRSRLNALR